jgi:hypothetical protein
MDWTHQAREYRIGRDKRARALIWPMRSGKSKACIDKACYQFEQGRIEGVIVIAPNGVHLNWTHNEIPKWGWWEMRTPRRLCVGDAEARLGRARYGIPAHVSVTRTKWFCINMEALKHLDCRRAVKDFIAQRTSGSC